MMSLLEDIAELLDGANVATHGEDLFLNILPDHPEEAVALFETPGRAADYTQSLTRYDRPRFQVLVRSASSQQGRERIGAIYEVVASVRNAIINDQPYLGLFPQQPPFFLRRDQNDRPIYAFNVEALCGFVPAGE